MKANVKFFLCAATALLAVSCGSRKSGASAPAGPMMMADPNAPTNVEIAVTEYRDVPQDETYTTSVQAYAVNNVVPQTGSRIKRILVEVGDFVAKGQVLAEMDQTSLEQTKLKLDNDALELSRLKELYEAGALSKSDYEAMQLSYNVSNSQYQNLVENTILRSPLTGVVTARNYDVGDMYAMSSPIFVVQQISPVKLLVGISETDYTKVKKGDSVDITADAIPGRTFVGKVNRIYPVIDPASHTFTAEVVVPNNDRVLRPGMFARAKVTFAINHSIVVPDIAIVKQQGSGQKSVFVLNADNTVSSRIVTLGRHTGSDYEILEGLSEGEKVVTKGHTNLRNGAEVNVIN
ncbi:MAG: efflux RND transporter periplasmic adaptor subunit [Bacteroidales bacterium]|jgi:RND family efflux transporter, MFP subunit|nr:efflux RND transporter periplasmic adaptor subunit [Bacteroidales bacterium]